MAAMRDIHRLLVQTFMSRSCLSVAEATSKFQQFCNRFDEAGESLGNCLRHINSNLREFQLEIKKATDEFVGSTYLVMVNRWESDITRLSTDYTPNELELFKALLQQLVTSDDGMVSSVEALNLTNQLQKRMTKAEAEDFYQRLTVDSWLSRTPHGGFYLSPRAVTELEQYILKSFEDEAKKCHMCGKLCVRGQRCSMCSTALHLHCAARLFHGSKTAQRCPGEDCKAPWTHKIPHGSRAAAASGDNGDSAPEQMETDSAVDATNGDDQKSTSPSSDSGARTRKRRK